MIKFTKKSAHLVAPVALVAALAISAFPAAAQSSPVTINIYVGLGTGFHPDQIKVEDALAKQWNDANPNTQVKFVYNDHANARDEILAEIQGDNPPDIVGPIGIKGTYETPALWGDLTPYITKDQAALKLDEYDPATLKVFQDASGKNLSVALGIYPSAMFVNEDIFKAAQIPLPPTQWGAKYTDKDGKQVTWDWNEVLTVAKQITSDKSGNYLGDAAFDPKNIQNYGFSNAWLDLRVVMMSWAPPTAGVSADGKTATFDSPEMQAAAAWYHQGIFVDHAIPDVAAEGAIGQGAVSPFSGGRLGMWYSPIWMLCCANGNFKWNVYAGPASPVNGKISSPMDVDTFLMVDKSKNKDAAWTVLKWLTSSDISSQLCLTYGCMPARKPARATWAAAQQKATPGINLQTIYDGVQYQDSPNNESIMPNYPQAFDAGNSWWTQVRTDPNLDVKTSLTAFNAVEQGIFGGKFPPTATPAPTVTPAPTAAATKSS